MDFSSGPLSSLVSPGHLSPSGVAALRARWDHEGGRVLVIDDLLRPDIRADLARTTDHPESFEESFKIFDQTQERNPWIDRDRFLAAPEDQRFIREFIYRGAKGENRISKPTLADLRMRKTFLSAAFRDWLGAITDERPDTTGPIHLKYLDRNSLLDFHSDAVPGRVLCLVLYLHGDWRPEYAGRFTLERQGQSAQFVEPLPNRALIFDPRADNRHAVEPLNPAMGEWKRINYTVWFYEGDAAP